MGAELSALSSTLLTIFLFSLFREPLLCKFLILIFVPLSAEVQVLGLRREQCINDIEEFEHL